MRAKPQSRQELVGEDVLGASAMAELGGPVLVRAMPLYVRLDLFGSDVEEDEKRKRTMQALQQFVLEPDGSPLGWDDNDWNVFGGNHSAAFTALVQKVAVMADLDGAAAKKPEAQSETSP